MTGFKDHVADDIKAIYHNITEHAELTRVRYNNKEAREIPVIFDSDGNVERMRKPGDFRDKADDLIISDLIVYIAASDLETVPRRETKIEIDVEIYNIIRVGIEDGIYRLWLEMLDE